MGQGPFAFLDGPKELALSGISHLDLTVTDLDRSLAFYIDVLGFRMGRHFDRPRFRGAFITHPGLTHSIGLGCPDARDGSAFDEYRTGLDHLSLRVPSHAELRRWEQHFVAHHVPHTPIVLLPDGAGVLVFRDPDNIQLELLAEPGT